MNSLLIHGVYDSQTLGTLKDKGVKEFSFDLRGKSSNLITFSELKNVLKLLTTEEVFLTFGDDKKETIESFLSLLKSEFSSFKLIFRDSKPGSFYQNLSAPFYWMYSPDGEWKEILSSENCLGILLPLKYERHYKNLPAMWELIEEKDLDVYLHAETFEQTVFIKNAGDVKLCIDLSSEIENSYRNVDRDKLVGQKIWSRKNENFAGQR